MRVLFRSGEAATTEGGGRRIWYGPALERSTKQMRVRGDTTQDHSLRSL